MAYREDEAREILRRVKVKGTRNITVTIPDFDDALFVEYTYYPGTRDVLYLRNGDPGYPGDPAECEIIKVSAMQDGPDLCSILTDAAIDAIEEECFADADCFGYEEYDGKKYE